MPYRLLFSLLGTLFAAAVTAAPFEWKAETEGSRLKITATVAPKHYFYAGTLEFQVSGADGKTLAPAKAPKPVNHDDEFFGATQIYPAGKHVWIFEGTPPFRAAVSYQGCRSAGDGEPAMCYMPEDLTLAGGTPSAETLLDRAVDAPLELDKLKTLRQTTGTLSAEGFLRFLDLSGSPAAPEEESLFGNAGLWWIILLTLLGGLGLNLTPCVLPMIPINLAIIGADTADRKNAVIRGCVYAAGIAIAYGVVGLAAVLGGATFGALDSCWYFNLGVAVVFVLLGLSMFDVFSIDLSRYGSNLKTPSTARLAGVFLLGAISALLAGACVAPVVIAVLIHSAGLYASGNPSGLLLPFLLGVGMGLPWPLIAAGIAVAPRPGKWMVKVKYAFGVLILLVGFYYGWLGARLLIASETPADRPEHHSAESIDKAFADATENGKPVLIDFWAEWCKNCKAMDLRTLKDPEVTEALKKFNFVKFDATAVSDPKVKTVMEKFRVSGLPTYVIAVPE